LSDTANTDRETSADEEPYNNGYVEARRRAEHLRRKYSLDEKMTQSPVDQFSKMDCLRSVLSFSLHHGFADVAAVDLFKLINVIMGHDVVPDSPWLFDKIFQFDSGVEYHFLSYVRDLRREIF